LQLPAAYGKRKFNPRTLVSFENKTTHFSTYINSGRSIMSSNKFYTGSSKDIGR